MPSRRGSKPLAKSLIVNALIVLIIGLVGVGAAAVISGNYQVRPVLSGSMRPGLPVGGVVITKRVPTSTLRVRDVVVFHNPAQPQKLLVHRIIKLTRDANGLSIQTQGDANNAPDPWTDVTLRGTTAYRAVYSVPLIGYAAVWTHSPTGREVLLVVGALLVAVAGASGLLHRRQTTRRARDVARRDQGGPLADSSLQDSAGGEADNIHTDVIPAATVP